ncbi:hypothetical protein CBM2589_B10040 [Cupriavidus taiwanensis]|uniref:Uncharacterized protein n=1 Tax=Cupriavidus taiwanensis TaxID=164546 RepID=A0A975WNC8_9BURK|nr:hypothetical protein CBM2589_B10040 [Cupriavidus taiwanensis]
MCDTSKFEFIDWFKVCHFCALKCGVSVVG